ncbi:DNA-binding transcriptional regulator, MerR family [Marinobacterium stanieri]|uniref:DNA-binding transcriptional regulator, MerR family n=1 Tax=Marinobacterium stanieri TaxID=49186 RepID=A0A1N6TDY5_9GAMM|nr:DNA-binding transcriptional regulator, MerR family [Marinobacterium stanieri]
MQDKDVLVFINEASKQSGATQRAIRLYESIGLMRVNRSGKYRVYSQENIKTIKMIKEAQTIGISLSEMVALRKNEEDFDWKRVSELLVKKQESVDNEIKDLELKKQRIIDYRISIDNCIRSLDSDL